MEGFVSITTSPSFGKRTIGAKYALASGGSKEVIKPILSIDYVYCNVVVLPIKSFSYQCITVACIFPGISEEVIEALATYLTFAMFFW